ncbi:MAG: ISL3 family transposase [Phascolarctobacterium sp.]|uniref:ISL3 family transposase n=1 Tax=Phascolarctobacterium sp. TaxID=2049039 RepID=UPI0026DBAC34|nr:ISL3 family transposase [Phascolarctobacterium sp.]MDO4920409.1 ISL3 family transposase [Phascolarctobacterium sp.]
MLQDNYNQNNPLFKGVILKSFQEIQDENNKSHFEACIDMPVKAHRCPHCGCITNKIKDYRTQIFKDADIFGNTVFIHLKKRRYFCSHCHKSFTEENPLIQRYRHFSSRFYTLVYKEFQSVQSFTAIAARFKVSATSIARWFAHIAYPHPKLPEYFSIDEFKGNAGGEKFQCNISDPVKRKVIDILPSRDTTDLSEHFLQYTKEDRNNVKGIVMDLSKIFRSIAHTLFPNAIIIADKFHVMRIVTNSLEKVRRRIQKEFRAVKRKWFKKSKKILLKKEAKLNEEERATLNRMLNSSKELEHAYILKENFYKVIESKTKEEAMQALATWLSYVDYLKVPEFEHCIQTFTDWRQEIANMAGSNLSNGFIEGTNNKIKVLKRISYGVQNFERFRNRILYLCS